MTAVVVGLFVLALVGADYVVGAAWRLLGAHRRGLERVRRYDHVRARRRLLHGYPPERVLGKW